MEDCLAIEIGFMRLPVGSGNHLEGILYEVYPRKRRRDTRNLVLGRGTIRVIDVVAIITVVWE